MPHSHSQRVARDYAKTPLNIYWEVTVACALACRHCRATAQPNADPRQLSFAEGLQLLDQIKDFGEPLPHLILTGGDPLARPDLFDLIRAARERGIGVSLTPAATPRLTYETMAALKDAGVEGVGLSLDGATAPSHEAIRGISGCFDHTMKAMQWCGDLGLPLQVNTLVTAETSRELADVYELLTTMPVARWSLFFLISVGRGQQLAELTPPAATTLMSWVYALTANAPFVIATTEAPSYRRVAVEQMQAAGLSGEAIKRSSAYRSFGIRDGNGIMFVSHTGDICPAGFLPAVAGNVRREQLVDVYRTAPLFQRLHDSAQFEGKCGACEYRALCGGSRARAYAATGHAFASDPLCDYQPKSERVGLPA
jgi:radical SAM protein